MRNRRSSASPRRASSSPSSQTGTSRCTTCSRASASPAPSRPSSPRPPSARRSPIPGRSRSRSSRLGVEAAQCLHVGDDPVHGRGRGGSRGHVRAARRPQRPRAGLAGRPHGAGGQARSWPRDPARRARSQPARARQPSADRRGLRDRRSYFAVGAAQFALVPSNVDIIYSPTAMLLTIVLYGAIGACRAVGRAADRATRGARSASSRRASWPRAVGLALGIVVAALA